MIKKFDYVEKLNELGEVSYKFANQKGFNSDTDHNDEVDAFRHIYSSALLTIQNNRMAQHLLGNIYEIMHQSPSEEKVMDFYNNQVGTDIGEKLNKNIKNLKFRNEDEIKKYLAFEVEQAIKSKEAIISLKDKRIIATLKNMPDHPMRVYTREEIDKMTTKEFSINEKNIQKNITQNKILTRAEAEQKVFAGSLKWINSYTRDDGTEVNGYYRRK